MTRIVIVDDHPLVRNLLRAMVESEKDLRVCGEAEDGYHALDVIKSAKPDMAILDLSLKGSDGGLDLIKEIQLRYPKLFLLVVSVHDESLFAKGAIRAGARGYITKQEATKEILPAIRQVLSGEIYLSAKMAGKVDAKMAVGPEPRGKWSI